MSKQGVSVIEDFLKQLPSCSGVYQMYSREGRLLYVGKALNLKNRVRAYTRPQSLPLRLQRMVASTASMDVMRTSSEAEALLLEATLIKKKKPLYNVDLRDDKTFPEILITESPHPKLEKYRRGHGRKKGKFFGPFASGDAVNIMVELLQKAFLLRTCSESVFRNRSRPCLKYQIKRCSAPCVGLISQEDYERSVASAEAFLKGKTGIVRKYLAERMHHAATERQYELAATYRDRLRAVTSIDQRQSAFLESKKDADIFVIQSLEGRIGVAVMFFRKGINFGVHTFFPSRGQGISEEELLRTFIGQFYVDRSISPLVFFNKEIPEESLLMEALSQKAGYRVEGRVPQKGAWKDALDLAALNVQQALCRKMSEDVGQNFRDLGAVLELSTPLEQIAVFDNSHIQGAHAVGAMVVIKEDGWDKQSYRQWNMPADVAGNDVGMLQEVMQRHILRVKSNAWWWDGRTLFLIDGGKPQLNAVKKMFAKYSVNPPILAIAKGPDRNAGKERFFTENGEVFEFSQKESLLFFLQRIRDEAHRFAIQSHRRKRSRGLKEDSLFNIEGIGAQRRRALLDFFGSSGALKEATVKDLRKVPGVSLALAKKIHRYFHDTDFS